MLLHAAAERRAARAKADLIDAIAFGYGGCQSNEGTEAMDRMLHALRDR